MNMIVGSQHARKCILSLLVESVVLDDDSFCMKWTWYSEGLDRLCACYSYVALGIALRYVLEALKQAPGKKMYMFGLTALDKFKTRSAVIFVLTLQMCEYSFKSYHYREDKKK